MSKLIETNFPFSQLSLIAEEESWRKEVFRPAYYLHKWWARRLGSVFRGTLLWCLLEESEDFWKHYYSKNSFEGTTVFDPFMGSGVTVGEAFKLGCRTLGRDINQVAYLACCAALSKYSPGEVHSVYKQLEKTLSSKLLSYFKSRTMDGEEATVLYYFLVKIVDCPRCGRQIDLFNTRIFSRNAVPSKDPSAKSICPGCGAINSIRFDADSVHCPVCASVYDPRKGNIDGAIVTCSHCAHIFRLVDRMKQLASPLEYRRYAKLLLRHGGIKLYEAMNDFDKRLEERVAREFADIKSEFPLVEVAPGYNTNQVLKHNYKFWHQMFSDRQLVCIKYLKEAILCIENAELRLLFSCLFSGVLEFNNLFTSFKGEGTGAVRHMFAHHVLKPEMMPLEANIWGTSKSSGAFSGLFHSRVERALNYKADPFEIKIDGRKNTKIFGINLPLNAKITDNFSDFLKEPKTVYLSNGDSSCTDLLDNSVDLVVTDPPFFDNVHYSQLADFFYYWLNQMNPVSGSTTTRSTNEVQDTDSELFTVKLTAVFSECRRVLRQDGLFVFTYHHSRHEGWTAVHRAIRHAGFVCVQSLPIKAEMSVSMPLKQAKSPIHLDLIMVCRKDAMKNVCPKGVPEISDIITMAKGQVASLKSVGIAVSLGDAKVILMGRLLCETHRMRNLDNEEKFLAKMEGDIDSIGESILKAKGEEPYQTVPQEPLQLILFEQIKSYFTDKKREITA